jgi:hypothetical protein
MTTFIVEFKFTGTGRIVEKRCSTPLARALMIISFSPWADVIRTWEE